MDRTTNSGSTAGHWVGRARDGVAGFGRGAAGALALASSLLLGGCLVPADQGAAGAGQTPSGTDVPRDPDLRSPEELTEQYCRLVAAARPDEPEGSSSAAWDDYWAVTARVEFLAAELSPTELRAAAELLAEHTREGVLAFTDEAGPVATSVPERPAAVARALDQVEDWEAGHCAVSDSP